MNHIYGFLNILRQNNIHITRVVLFGSYAKGNPHAYSDIDLAIWADEFSGYALIDVDLLIPGYRSFGGISVRSYKTGTTCEDDPFIIEIEQTGIELNPVTSATD